MTSTDLGRALDVAAVRAAYPALADGWAYLDGAAGTQVPTSVIEAVAQAWRDGIGNHGGAFAASRRSDEHTAAARLAVADLVGAADPTGVLLGPNMTTMTYRVANALAPTWGPGDEVVVTRLDHDANVRPWVQAARRAGATVRFVDPVLPTLDLPTTQFADALGERTRLVAVTAASNVVGTRPDVRAVADAAHAVGALVYVDGVHATPHGPVDVTALGADVYATSAYKWSGPHLGALVADPALWEGLHPDRLASSPPEVPYRFETGTSPFAQHAGLAAAVDHLAGLAPSGGATRRERLLASMAAVEAYEAELFGVLLAGLEALPHVHPIGAPASRTATAYFTVDGHSPQQVAEHCARARVNVWAGHMYAWELTGLLGIRDSGSAVRAGLVHYNDRSDVDRLLEALADLA
ncbi:MAG: cysteine desulfurase-like protein [Actinomycetes bacterium]